MAWRTPSRSGHNGIGDFSVSSTLNASHTGDNAVGAIGKPAVKVRAHTALVTWRAPNNGGSTITGYRVKVNGKTYRLAGSAHRLALRRLRPGTYKVAVRAVNRLARARSARVARFRIRA